MAHSDLGAMACPATQLAEVLEFIMHHSDLPEYPYPVCSLLCTSSRIRAITTQHGAGRMAVEFPNRWECHDVDIHGILHFMKTQGHLLHSLHMELPDPVSSEAEQERESWSDWESGPEPSESEPHSEMDSQVPSRVELEAAAALKYATLLQHLSLEPLSPVMLEAGSSCSQLTHLSLHHWGQSRYSAAQHHLLLHQGGAAFSQLPQLKRLELSTPGGPLDVVMGAASCLTNLTFLSMSTGPVADAAALQRLPASLQDLEVSVSEMRHRNSNLNLSHLTALTRLCRARAWYENLPNKRLCEGDVLPPNVEVLQLAHDDSIQPLLGLSSLRELGVYHCGSPAADLQALSNLQALTGVRLTYRDWQSAAQGATAWGSMPLVSLSIHGHDDWAPAAATLQQLGRATSLTKLELHGNNSTCWDGVVADLAAALQQLSMLQELDVWCANEMSRWEPGLRVPAEESTTGIHGLQQSEADWLRVAQSICQLPQLRQLELDDLPLGSLAGSKLPPAPQVTQLRLLGRYSEPVLMCFVHSFIGLHCLDVLKCVAVSDAVLAAIARQLCHLRKLDVFMSQGYTPSGIAQLSCLQQLDYVHIAGAYLHLQDLRTGNIVNQLSKY